MPDLNPMLREHKAWRELCEALEETGAVTRADLESPATERETPGQQLIELIREWGFALVTMRKAESEGLYNAANEATVRAVKQLDSALTGIKEALADAHPDGPGHAVIEDCDCTVGKAWQRLEKLLKEAGRA